MRPVADDPGVVFGVGGGGGGVPQLRQISVAADVLDLAALLQLLGQQHHIDGLAALVVKGDDCLMDFLMGVGVEILGAQQLHDDADNAVLAQHTAEDATFRLPTLRRQTFRPGAFRRHWPTSLRGAGVSGAVPAPAAITSFPAP